MLASQGILAGDWVEGVVTKVQDGDSIILKSPEKAYRIRLLDIDAPELAQPYGQKSRVHLKDLCYRKQARVEVTGEDRYQRTLGRAYCLGVDASSAQVREGWAWVFRRYAPQDSPLYQLEAEARMARRGLWADESPQAPWIFRAENRRTQ